MDQRFNDAEADGADTVEKLKRKYLERRKQVPPSEDINSGHSDEAVQRLTLAHRSRRPSKELKCYSTALDELFKAVTKHPEQLGSDDDLNLAAAPLQDSHVLCTETDVTLPSCLDVSPGSHQTVEDGELQRAHQPSESCCSSSLVLVKVYQEMMTIYEQLKAERQSQQQWERELHEREKRLERQEEAFGRLAGLEEMLQTRMLAVEEQHQQELSELQDRLQERNKENRRLKSSFDTIKELNDSMKKQLNEISEQNRKLESQSKRVQARLENLQRKYEHSIASRGCQQGSVESTEYIKQSKKERTAASAKNSNKGGSSPTSPKLLAVLLDWALDGPTLSSVAGYEGNGAGRCLPPEVELNDRCLKALPLLADQLHHTPPSEPDLLRSLLRLTHGALRHVDDSAQHAALSATLRRIGEDVWKPAAQSEENRPLYRSPCPHTRVLATLIALRTVTQADVLARALDGLHAELRSEESRGLFVHYGGVCALLAVLRASRAGLRAPVDILAQLTEQSRYLNPFLEACSCEEFFRTATQLLKHPCLELPSLEKLSILLQKLSSVRRNRRLFELSALRLQIQELYRKTDRTHTFLCLNLRSVLLNLK